MRNKMKKASVREAPFESRVKIAIFFKQYLSLKNICASWKTTYSYNSTKIIKKYFLK